MDKFITLINDTKERKFRLSQTKKGIQLHQTDRNDYKKELMQALKDDLSEVYDYVYMGADGILVEIANDVVADGVESAEASGAITIAIDIKVLGLDTNAEMASECYAAEMQVKADKKAERLANKQAKLAKKKEG